MDPSDFPHQQLPRQIVHSDQRFVPIDDEASPPTKPLGSTETTAAASSRSHARAAPTFRYYDAVAVLLIKWADELDELKTRAEVRFS